MQGWGYYIALGRGETRDPIHAGNAQGTGVSCYILTSPISETQVSPAAGGETPDEASPPYRVLYVSDIDQFCVEEQSWHAFASWANSIRSICSIRDDTRHGATSHAFINFSNDTDCADAYHRIQPSFSNYSFCRVYPYDGVHYRKPPKLDAFNGSGIFIKNLDVNLTVNMSWGYFMGFGRIQGCRIAANMFGASRGFGYITYETPEQAAAAIAEMNGKQLGARNVVVTENRPRNFRGYRLFIKFGKRPNAQSQRHFSTESSASSSSDGSKDGTKDGTKDGSRDGSRDSETTVGAVSDEAVEKVSRSYASFDSISFPKDALGQSRGFAFATLNDIDEAHKAIEEITQIGGYPATVDFATSSASSGTHTYPENFFPAPFAAASQGGAGGLYYDTSHTNGHRHDHGGRRGYASGAAAAAAAPAAAPQSQGGASGAGNSNTNLFVRPLAADITESDLASSFEPHGNVISTKIMTNGNGQSRGFGFVSFSDSESATRAAAALDGTKYGGVASSVTPALVRKQHQKRSIVAPRNASLAAAHAQRSPVMFPPSQMPFPGYYYVPVDYAAMRYRYGASGAVPPPSPSPVVRPELDASGLDGGPPTAYLAAASLDDDAAPGKNAAPAREASSASAQEIGESSHPIVLQHPRVGGQLEVANIVTGMSSQQPLNDIIEWMKVPPVSDNMISQAATAYESWVKNSSQISTQISTQIPTQSQISTQSQGPGLATNSVPAAKQERKPDSRQDAKHDLTSDAASKPDAKQNAKHDAK